MKNERNVMLFNFSNILEFVIWNNSIFDSTEKSKSHDGIINIYTIVCFA